jgi:transposase
MRVKSGVMKDTEFFAKLLEISEPWQVAKVEMDVPGRRIEITVECQKQLWADPATRERVTIHGYEERSWRDMDIRQMETIIHARVPRLRYPDGHTELLGVPWAEPRGRFTTFFEVWAVQVLAAAQSISQACALLRLDWSAAQRIMQRAVARGLARRDLEGLRYVGLDEKSFGQGQSYVAVLSDLAKGRVLEVEEGRDEQSGRALWQSLPAPQRAQVEAAAMDMSAGFAAATRAEAPQAQIVHDKFHVSKLLGEAVDQVRRGEVKADDRLKGSRQLWLYNPMNLEDERLEALQRLAEQNTRTARAWLQKENFSGFWAQASRYAGEGYLKAWYRSAIHCRLEPIKKVARTLKRHAETLLNYFAHPITNAVAEGLNSRIQQIKSNARGFRVFEHYRTRILFFCGKLDLLPR